MTLFDPPSGTAQELLPHHGSLLLYLDVLTPESSRSAFASLSEDLDWRQNHIKMFGRVMPEPRLVSWIGDQGVEYTYSGLNLLPAPWSPLISELRIMCEDLAGTSFNSVLANLYRTGSDGVGWHSDDEPELGIDPVIASLSLGAERRFDLRHKISREQVKIGLPPGSVAVMSGSCQSNWHHRIAKTKRPIGPRINLTFRTISGEFRNTC